MALCRVFPPMEHNMDTDSLMRVLPEELGNVLLQRRLMLKDTLPGVIRNLEAEEDIISPKVERLKSSFRAFGCSIHSLIPSAKSPP